MAGLKAVVMGIFIINFFVYERRPLETGKGRKFGRG
jgi:hypothetical protein